MYKNCPNCQTLNDEQAPICGTCFTDLLNIEAEEPAQEPQRNNEHMVIILHATDGTTARIFSKDPSGNLVPLKDGVIIIEPGDIIKIASIRSSDPDVNYFVEGDDCVSATPACFFNDGGKLLVRGGGANGILAVLNSEQRVHEDNNWMILNGFNGVVLGKGTSFRY